MAQLRGFPLLFVAIGLVCGGITAVALPRMSSPPEILASVSTLLISIGFLLTGAIWITERDSGTTRYVQIPAITLLALGVGGILVGTVTLRPFRSGITGGLRMILTGIVVITGSAVSVVGWRWFRRQEMRYPLAILTMGLITGLSFVLYEATDDALTVSPIPTSVLLLIPLVAVGPGLVVVYRFPVQIADSG